MSTRDDYTAQELCMNPGIPGVLYVYTNPGSSREYEEVHSVQVRRAGIS
jgi:hypothetical protein